MPLLKKTQITSTFITSHPHICLTCIVTAFAGVHLFWGVSGFGDAQVLPFPSLKQLSVALAVLVVLLSVVLVLLVDLVLSVVLALLVAPVLFAVRVAWVALVAFVVRIPWTAPAYFGVPMSSVAPASSAAFQS